MQGYCKITPAGYAHMTHMLSTLAGGKIILVLEVIKKIDSTLLFSHMFTDLIGNNPFHTCSSVCVYTCSCNNGFFFFDVVTNYVANFSLFNILSTLVITWIILFFAIIMKWWYQLK
jgi:hypothetical protein